MMSCVLGIPQLLIASLGIPSDASPLPQLPRQERVTVESSCTGTTRAVTDKTLVAWVLLEEGDYAAGSVLTLQQEDRFDAIVYGELKEDTWMAGSNFFQRTSEDQEYASEVEGGNELIQVAIVYQNNRLTLLRNGKILASYETENIDLFQGENQAVVFGLRHLGGGGQIQGQIEDARIYRSALSIEEIKSLEPNQQSESEAWAWWDFEGDELKDRAGRFNEVKLTGDAKLEDGRLVLGYSSVVVATRNEETMDWASGTYPVLVGPDEYEVETPTMPSEIPANWLTYHLAHPGPGRAVPGDPNAACFSNGRYHLHYIYRNKYGFCFAHLSSTDMVTWEWHPTVLAPPITGHGMFSGTAFFTKEGQPAIIYHGQGSGRNWIAYAADEQLNEWRDLHPVVPKLPDGSVAQSTNWDPDCWLRNGTYYAISGGRPPELLKSDDLYEWEFLDNLFHEETDFDALGLDPNEDVSCANMFKIRDKWMLLCISHDLGCRYYLGDFKEEKYLPESHALMSWNGARFFAPESLLTPDGRRVMWAWVTEELATTQSGLQSLPRELSLPEDGVLRIKPLRELQKLRYDEEEEGKINVQAGNTYRLKKIVGNTVELSITVQPTDADDFGLRVFCDEEGGGMPIHYLSNDKVLAVGNARAPLELKQGEVLELTIFLDRDMVEVFANDRQAITTGQRGGSEKTGIELFSKGGPMEATVRGWKMRSIYQSAPAE